MRLADWGVIRAIGADAASFLHSQLTQDIENLAPGVARLAGYCSAKGRLLASFIVWRGMADDEILLACSADVLASTLKRLSMFVLRAKCTLSDASAELPLWGVVGPAASGPWRVTRDASGDAIRLPDVDGQSRQLLATRGTVPAPPPLDAGEWSRLEVRSGIARIVARTAEQFVPQMVNLELVGGVNFQKGCYPGQEIVARSQYRGTIKRRAMLFETDSTLAPGDEVFHEADPAQPAGMVVNAAPRAGRGSVALIEVKLSALDAGSLHAGAANGPLLAPAALPYELAADTA